MEGGSPGGACIFVVFVVTPPSARVFPDCISSYVAVSQLVWFGKAQNDREDRFAIMIIMVHLNLQKTDKRNIAMFLVLVLVLVLVLGLALVLGVIQFPDSNLSNNFQHSSLCSYSTQTFAKKR